MLVSLIIPTYKDLRALELILEALIEQDYTNFEVIVAEDDNSQEVKAFLASHEYPFKIHHFSHEDQGMRKAIAINQSIKLSQGEYLIFIDGDVIPYTSFITSHVSLAEPKRVLCGRRVNLGDNVSTDIREGRSSALELQRSLLLKLPYLMKDNGRHFEQGLYFNPKGLIFKLLSQRDTNVHLLGSNFSLFKEDVLAINGVDEALYGGWNDFDIEWRLIASGTTPKTCKYSANLFHLNHERHGRKERNQKQKAYIQEKRAQNTFYCQDGLQKV
ncbi:MAG: glycosyltransferase [Campylobacterota bacterium]|nr:glycosyltransferase [Campylobacterota bacterium]